MQSELETQLKMTYVQYSYLTKNEQIKLWKENSDYIQIGAFHEMILDEMNECAFTKGKSKYERFKYEVYSGQLFK